MYNLLLPSPETSQGLTCAGVVEKWRERRRKGERSKHPSPAVPYGEEGCDSKWCILWQRGNAFIPWAVAASECSGPGLWLPEEEGAGPWLYWPDEKVCKLGGVVPGGCKTLTGASCPRLHSGRLWADDVAVSGSSQVADHPSETTIASMDQHSGIGPELGKAGSCNRLCFSDLEKTQARNGWQF